MLFLRVIMQQDFNLSSMKSPCLYRHTKKWKETEGNERTSTFVTIERDLMTPASERKHQTAIPTFDVLRQGVYELGREIYRVSALFILCAVTRILLPFTLSSSPYSDVGNAGRTCANLRVIVENECVKLENRNSVEE